MSAEQALESCEYFANDRVTLYEGDCIEVMRRLPENSVDAVVTDPPYGLEFMGKEWDKLQTAQWRGEKEKWQDGLADNHIAHRLSKGPRYGNEPSAMQEWHSNWATEALRILKPGGHLLAFGGTRTWHRLAAAIEDAGFEVRDSIAWMYGSGFPKSHDVSKGIDKQRDDRDDVLRVTGEIARLRDVAGLTNRNLDDAFGFAGMAGHWTSVKSQPTVPTVEQWAVLRDMLNPDEWLDAEVWRLNGRKGTPGEAWAEREVTGQYETAAAAQQWMSNYGQQADLTAKERKDKPATPAAEQWQGWGTALKPAHEPIVVARKPLIGTVAENVLAHGTGALNIDGSRIGTEQRINHTSHNKSSDTVPFGLGHETEGRTATGRWPANVILDESQAAELDAQSGVQRDGVAVRRNGVKGGHIGPPMGHNDTGGASRFFYCPKANKKERPNVDGVAHPTVKPLALMRYLCKLVTPPGGTILEPFSGSGTTIEAALLEGFNVIGIEMTEEYLPLIMARIERYDEGMF